MNTFSRYIVTTLADFLSGAEQDRICKSRYSNGTFKEGLYLYSQFPDLKSMRVPDNQVLLVIEFDFSDNPSNQSNITDSLSNSDIAQIFVSNDSDKKSLEWDIGLSSALAEEKLQITIWDEKPPTTRSEFPKTSGAVVTSNKENALKDNKEVEPEDDNTTAANDEKIDRLASALAIALSHYKLVKDEYVSNFDFSTFCLESWLMGRDLFADAYQTEYRKYCKSFDELLAQMMDKSGIKTKAKILYQGTAYTHSPDWLPFIELITSISSEDSRLDSSGKQPRKKKLKLLDDVIFREALKENYESVVNPGSAFDLANRVFSNITQSGFSRDVNQIRLDSTRLVKQGTGITEFIKRFPELRKTIALLIFLGSDRLEDFNRIKSRVEKYKKDIGAVGYWAYLVFYGIRNGYPGLVQVGKERDQDLLFNSIRARLIKTTTGNINEEPSEPFSSSEISTEKLDDGAFVVKSRQNNDAVYGLKYLPEADLTYRKLFIRLSREELRSFAQASIIKYASQLGLEKWPFKNALTYDIEIKGLPKVQVTHTRNSTSINSIPIESVNLIYRWVDWDEFLSFIRSTDKKEINRAKKLVREAESIWGKVLNDIDKSVQLLDSSIQ